MSVILQGPVKELAAAIGSNWYIKTKSEATNKCSNNMSIKIRGRKKDEERRWNTVTEVVIAHFPTPLYTSKIKLW